MIRRLKFLQEAQWWPPEQLYRERDRLLARLIRIAAHEVPFYQDVFCRSGVKWDQIRHLADLGSIPVVTKEMLRPQYPEFTTRRTGQRTYETGSSGSTGANFLVREDAETAGWYRASLLLALEWAGWQVGEPHVQMGITPNRSLDRKLKDILLGCHYVSAFDLTDRHLDATLDLIERFAIRHLWGYPAGLYFLAQRAIQMGWNQPLQSIVTWGDNVYPHYRRTIERAFKSRIFDTYGCGEGAQISAQCGHADHYHIHTLDVIVEYVDEQGNPVPPGTPGNVIVTRLHPGPMPLIRYRIGDVAVGAAGQACPCGRGYDLMAAIQGRDTDVVMTPSGNRLIVHFFTGILENFTDVASFQAVQPEDGTLLLRVVPARGAEAGCGLVERIVAALRERGAADMTIHVEFVSAIPASPSGKRRFVISKLCTRGLSGTVETSCS